MLDWWNLLCLAETSGAETLLIYWIRITCSYIGYLYTLQYVCSTVRSSLIKQQNSTLLLLWGKPPASGEFSSQRAINEKSFSMQWRNHDVFLPFNITLPNTVESLVEVLQFHRWFLNCFWHSRTPSLAPRTTLSMTSGWARQRRLWREINPGMLSQMIPLPTRDNACTGNWLIYLEKEQEDKLNT